MTGHDLEALGGYVLGILGPDETAVVERHLAGCSYCQGELAELSATRDLLGEVPSEAFLEGLPEDGDLLLQRTLRAMRAEAAATNGAKPVAGRRLLVAAAGTVILTAAAVTGGVIGRQTVPATVMVAPSSSGVPGSVPSATPSATPPGARTMFGQDPGTGAALTAVVTPAAGWVRVHATVTGVPAGTECQLVVLGKDGSSVVAGSWLVSPAGEAKGTALDGSALVAPAQVASVAVVTLDGRQLVSATG